MAVGQGLFQQIADAEAYGPRLLVATGTSCHEQLASGLKREVFYPTELLAALVPKQESPASKPVPVHA